MPHTKCETVYSFSELSDRAKERARAWYREGAMDHEWWEFIYEDAARCADILGISLRQKPVKLMNGTTRYDPAIYFSGFSSQGDGASWEGHYSYKKGCAKAIRAYAPKDADLHRIADELVAIQRKHGYALEASASATLRGHYCHSGCMSVEVGVTDSSRDVDSGTEEALRDTLRSFGDWIYRQLEREYEWQMANEQVDEAITANEYEFTEAGAIA